jgi:ribulose-phosphate 3-epimerase
VDIQIVPSVLPVDFARLGDEVAALDDAGVDMFQWDVMDGQFVPNITFGPDVIAAARRFTDKPFEAHLMIHTPELLAKEFVQAGCSRLIVHYESCIHVHRALMTVQSHGATAGIALNPSTPATAVEHLLDMVDLVLVMTINPGFGGQAYLPSMEAKIRQVRSMIGDRPIRLEIDGGVNAVTIGGAAAAGVDTFVAGSALYKHADGLKAAVTELRSLAHAR